MPRKQTAIGAAAPVSARVKICGLTRPEDTAVAVASGTDYVGVVFAGGPREIAPEDARAVLGPASGRALRVGVFPAADADRISDYARVAGLDVAQVHGGEAVSADEIRAVRTQSGLAVWAVVRVPGAVLPPAQRLRELFEAADAVLLEAYVPGVLGGSGRQLPWSELAATLTPLRVPGSTLVLAGGLKPTNVAHAIEALSPDVVDVSSGIEVEPGVKDHALIRTFIAAARGGI